MKAREIDILGLARGEYNYIYDLLPCHNSQMPFSKKLNVAMASTNLVFHNPAVYYYPVSVWVELTNYCNLQCPMCPTGNKTLLRKPQYMSTDIFRKVVGQLKPYTLLLSLWAWGEPLLHPELEDILRICYNRGMQIVISTNGQNLNKESVVRALLKYPPTYLIVALDGITDESNSVYRVGAKLLPALEGVNQLAHRRNGKYPILHMRTIIMKQNEKELDNIHQFAKDNKFDSYSLRSLVQIASSHDEFKKYIPESQEYRAYEYQDGKVIKKQTICKDLFMLPTILANGDVVACCVDYDGKLKYGNLLDKSFKDIWFSKKATDIRQSVIEFPDNAVCVNCPTRDCTRPITSMEYHLV